MTIEIFITLIILLCSIFISFKELLPTDLTALLIMGSLIITGILTPQKAFASFSNHTLITLACIFILTEALFRTGILSRLSQFLTQIGKKNHLHLFMLVLLLASGLSGLINNIAVVALLLPIIMQVARHSKFPPSKILIPFAYAAVMGGTLTLIGTPSNLILNDILEQTTQNSLSIFSFSLFSLVWISSGILYLILFGKKILPDYPIQEKILAVKNPAELIKTYQLTNRIFTFQIKKKTALLGKTLCESQLGKNFDLNVISIFRKGQYLIPSPHDVIKEKDILILEGNLEQAQKAQKKFSLEQAPPILENKCLPQSVGVAEAIIAPRSHFNGKTLTELNFREKYCLNVLAIWRQGDLKTDNLTNLRLSSGDTLLITGPWKKIQMLHEDTELILFGNNIKPKLQNTAKIITTTTIFIITIILMITKLVPISVATFLGALFMLLTKSLSMEDAYHAMEWKALFIVAGTMTLGFAIQETGTAEFIVTHTLVPLSKFGNIPLILSIYLLSSFFSTFINNTASAAIMGPLAINLAQQLNLNPTSIIIIAIFGSSTAFITPTAHQSNLLIMGPGDYQFKDFFKIGIGLTITLSIVTAIFVPLFFPL